MASNVSIPKGTRDFSPVEMIRRKYIFNTVEDVFRLYGYQPIETPSLENLSTLLGKYGEEGDKLIYQIRSNKNLREKFSKEKLETLDSIYPYWLPQKSELGLRYDLTVPFARFVVMHQNDLTFPFKRYQIQPVWRADKPQKSRYREFYQCDVDVIGSNSLLNEVELIQIIDKIFRKLGIEITIKLNNRKILSGIAEIIGANDKIIDIAVALDKVEKIGWENVIKELQLKGLTENSINLLFDIFDYGERSDKSIVLNAPKAPDRLILGNLLDTLKNSNIGIKGINEVLKILEIIKEICFDIDYKIEFDPSLARGLNYYTGAIFEVKANAVAIGSICGGGRYDDLTSIFGLPGVSGVGVSFGADRIYDVMNELNLFPSETNISTKVLFVNFGDEEEMYALNAIINMRNAGIASEIYPDASKLKKQFYYADCRNIPYVVIAGSEEIDQNCFKLKNMATREEKKISLNEMINELKNEYI